MGNAVIVRTTGENLELLTAGEAERLAARMEAIRDRALQKIAEAFAKRSAHQQERSASAPARRQPCRNVWRQASILAAYIIDCRTLVC